MTNESLRVMYCFNIPVLFLNGEFVCMHDLNVPLLDAKLSAIEKKDAETE